MIQRPVDPRPTAMEDSQKWPVLLYDKNPGTLRVLIEQLQSHGFKAEAFERVQALKRYAQTQPASIAVLSISSTDLEAIEVAQHLNDALGVGAVVLVDSDLDRVHRLMAGGNVPRVSEQVEVALRPALMEQLLPKIAYKLKRHFEMKASQGATESLDRDENFLPLRLRDVQADRPLSWGVFSKIHAHRYSALLHAGDRVEEATLEDWKSKSRGALAVQRESFGRWVQGIQCIRPSNGQRRMDEAIRAQVLSRSRDHVMDCFFEPSIDRDELQDALALMELAMATFLDVAELGDAYVIWADRMRGEELVNVGSGFLAALVAQSEKTLESSALYSVATHLLLRGVPVSASVAIPELKDPSLRELADVARQFAECVVGKQGSLRPSRPMAAAWDAFSSSASPAVSSVWSERLSAVLGLDAKR